jgi:zinc and cadmium transporter
MIFNILLAVTIISLISLVGVFALSMRKKLLKKILFILVAFAAGTLLGSAFFDLLPGALEETMHHEGLHHDEHEELFEIHEDEEESYNFLPLFLAVISGILCFFIIERFIFWHHCHHNFDNLAKNKPCTFTHMNLIGDGFHNLLDGVIIAGAFLHDTSVGIAVTIAVALHEIPQEIGDFAILLQGGLSRAKALFFNFLSSLTAIFGAIIASFYLSAFETVIPWMLAFTAGGFIYIAVADLFPEMKKEQSVFKGLLQLAFLILGVMFVWLLVHILPHSH